MTARARQSGFSLSEALVALAVAAIGLSVAAPGLKSLSSQNQLAVSVNHLVSTMHLARSEAVMRNARVGVCASSDGEHCDGSPWENGWIAFVDADSNQQRAATEALVDRVAGIPGLEVDSEEFAHQFSYRANGRVIGAGNAETTGEFVLCEPGSVTASRVIIVQASGLPALADTRRDGSSAGCGST